MYTKKKIAVVKKNPKYFISLFTPISVTAVGRRELSRGVWGSEWAPLLKSYLRHFMCGMNWQACLNTQMRSVRGASVSNESWYSLRGTEQLQLLWPVVYKGVKKKGGATIVAVTHVKLQKCPNPIRHHLTLESWLLFYAQCGVEMGNLERRLDVSLRGNIF